MRVCNEMVVGNQARSDELAIIISYPTRASRVIVSLKTPTKYREFGFILFVRTTVKVSGRSCHAGTAYARGGGEGVIPYKGLMGTCSQPGYVFRNFCLKQGIEFIIFCLNQSSDLSIFVLNRINVLNRV